MQLQIASDLHLEFLQGIWPGERIILPATGADVLILAGDIAADTQAFGLFADWPVPVIYVAGNHEFYGGDIDERLTGMTERSTRENIHFLENESVVIGDTRFIGATLWTDYRLYASPPQSKQMEYAERCINDHRSITMGERTFTTLDALVKHEVSRAFIEGELAKPWTGKTVVVTHHGPHQKSVHPRYAGKIVNSAFCSDLGEILKSDHAPALWIHGHVHDSFDYRVGKASAGKSRVRVVANPAGYIRNRNAQPSEFLFENASFNHQLVVEV